MEFSDAAMVERKAQKVARSMSLLMQASVNTNWEIKDRELERKARRAAWELLHELENMLKGSR